ncbi:hypothetical protein Scep_003661 [Stephania cephalantha]|uniref:Uncharacterized protein n=1 Tax=Stephania cephalantha TaxID=152367 RepID=A0AAP0PUL5_9MAGN
MRLSCESLRRSSLFEENASRISFELELRDHDEVVCILKLISSTFQLKFFF